jgi:hypothetical protein
MPVAGGDQVYEQPVMGSAMGDGMHATMAADGASTYYLGVDPMDLEDMRIDDIFHSTERIQDLERTQGELPEVRAHECATHQSRCRGSGCIHRCRRTIQSPSCAARLEVTVMVGVLRLSCRKVSMSWLIKGL